MKVIMRQLLFAFLFLTNVCVAQTYEETVAKCIKAVQNSLPTGEQLKPCLTGLQFPSFKGTTIDDKYYSLEDLNGKIVLINLWFIRCPPCIAEIPILNELAKEYSEDFVILSFGLDDRKSIIDFLEKRPMNFPVFADSKDLIKNTFKMNLGYPTNVLLNKEGQIIEFKMGASNNEVGLRRMKEDIKKIVESELSK
jgi:thiol-disulfide isomerase/thioredoxin